MSERMIWCNDRVVASQDAHVSIDDRSFLSGYGVFETLLVERGHPFAITRHLQRLGNSARIAGIALPTTNLAEAVNELIAANRDRIGDAGRLRITVTAGPDSQTVGNVVMTCDPQPPHPESVHLLTVPWTFNDNGPLVGAKVTSYADNLAVLNQVRAMGADEAVMADTAGRVCECTTANVVYSFDDQLVTPTLETGCLPGVTRALLIEWGLVAEHDHPIEVLAQADEILISSSTRALLPAHQLDERTLVIGELGAAAAEEFRQRAADDLDP